MISDRIAAALIVAARVAAARAVAAKRERLLTAFDSQAGIAASPATNGVVLTGRGLRARAFGTRKVPRDVRLLPLLEDYR